MKKFFWAILLCCWMSPQVHSQSFTWAKTLGSMYTGASSLTMPRREHITYLCTDANNNAYAAILVRDSLLKADTFYQAGGRNKFGDNAGSLLLASHTCGGSMRWARLFENRGDVICYGMQYYAGSIYVAGRFGDSTNPNRYIGGVKLTGHDSQHYFLARFDTLGTLRWIRFVGANDQSSTIKLSSASFYPGEDDHSLAIDGQGNIHHLVYLNSGVKITQFTTAQKGTYDLKYDASGTLLGAVRLGVDSSYYLVGRTTYSSLTPGNKNAVSISKRSGKIFAAMSKVTGSTPPTQFRLCAFSPGGALLWEDTLTRSILNASTGGGGLRDVAYDGANGIYVSGEGHFGQFRLNGFAPVYTPALPNRLLSAIIKVDTNGIPQWIYANEHSFNVGVLGNTTILPNGNILSAGSSSGAARHGKDSVLLPTGWSAPFYTIVSPQGTLIKMDVAQRSNSGFNSFTAAATDKLGNVYLGGMQMSDTLRFPGGPVTVQAPNTYNGDDAFIARMGMDCRCTIKAKAGFKDSVSATDEQKVIFTYTGTTEAVDSIVWTFGKGQKVNVTTGFTNPIVRTYASGTRNKDTVCVIVYSACGKDTFCTYPPALGLTTPVGIADVKIYPNPVNSGRFVVSFDAERPVGAVRISVSDIAGQQVYGEVYMQASSHFSKEIVLNSPAPGVYVLILSNDRERIMRKIVIQ